MHKSRQASEFAFAWCVGRLAVALCALTVALSSPAVASEPLRPYAAEASRTLNGCVRTDGRVTGIVSLKVSRPRARRGADGATREWVRLSGYVVGRDGRKCAVKPRKVSLPPDSPLDAELTLKGSRTMRVRIGGDGFCGMLDGSDRIESALVGGDWPKRSAYVHVDFPAFGASGSLPSEVVADLLPFDESFAVHARKWAFAKPARVRMSGRPRELRIDTSRERSNRSGVRISYAPKTGCYKGRFNVYGITAGENSRRLWKRTAIVTGFVVDGGGYGAVSCRPLAAAGELSVVDSLLRIGDGAYGSTSVNTTVFRGNSLVTSGDVQYAAYYDADGVMVLAKRRHGASEWETSRTGYVGSVEDAHRGISIMADGEGVLHVAFDHHATGLKYCRSVAPGSLELGPLEPMVGRDEDKVTYPEFFSLQDGNLLCAYRSGASGNGDLVVNRYSLSERKWGRVHDVLIAGEGVRNAYWQMCGDPAGGIHLSWVWRETNRVETNHDLCYARSLDGGLTWERSDGTAYELPITMETAEYACRIPQGSELINQTGMCADEKGRPYIATYWRDADVTVPQYRLVWHDGARWVVRQVMDRVEPFSLSGGGTKMIPIARPRIATDGGRFFYLFRDVERGSRVSVARTEDILSGHWDVEDLTDFSVDAWEPTFDTELWNRFGKLDVFVQESHQGDGERVVESDAATAMVLRVD